MANGNNEDCAICNFIRWYLMLGVPIIALIWARPELTFLQGVDGTSIAATVALVAFIAVVAWKYYDEYLRK